MGLLIFGKSGAPLSVSGLGWSIIFSTTFAYGLLAVADGNWDSWTKATCLQEEGRCFCEKPRDTLMRQPANTWSNLAFTVVGALVLCEGAAQANARARIRRPFTTSDALGDAFVFIYGLSCVTLGIGSGWYHASLTLLGQFLDNAGMYLVVTGPALYALKSVTLHRMRLSNEKNESAEASLVQRYLVEWFTINFMVCWLCFAYPVTRRYVFFVLVVFALAVELYARSAIGELRTQTADITSIHRSLFFLVLAFSIWIADNKGWICEPESLIQGHAAWHLLTGYSAFLLFEYYHSLTFNANNDAKDGSVSGATGSCTIV